MQHWTAYVVQPDTPPAALLLQLLLFLLKPC